MSEFEKKECLLIRWEEFDEYLARVFKLYPFILNVESKRDWDECFVLLKIPEDLPEATLEDFIQEIDDNEGYLGRVGLDELSFDFWGFKKLIEKTENVDIYDYACNEFGIVFKCS